MIKNFLIHRVLFLLLFIGLTGSCLGLCQTQTAATAKEPAQIEIGLDVQAYILMASTDPVGKNKVPATLENVAKQLGAVIGTNNLSLVASYFYRLKQGGTLDVSGIGAWTTVSASFAVRPPYYSLYLNDVSFVNKNQPVIQIRHMKFGMSVPMVSAVQSVPGKDVIENIQYRDIGIVTELNLSEGTPTVVGTLNTSQPDKTLIVVLAVKRSQ